MSPSLRPRNGLRWAAVPRLSLVAVVGGVSACDPWNLADVEPPTGAYLGFLEYYDKSADLQIPAEVGVGEPVSVTVITYGPGACVERAGTEVFSRGRSREIVPFDRFPSGEGTACLDILESVEHRVSLVFDERGTGGVRVHGRRWPEGDTISVRRTIVVR